MVNLELKIENMTEEQAKIWLGDLVEWLNDLDSEDFFGTEGWLRMFHSK